MNAHNVPACLCGSLPVSQAFEQGYQWGAAGLSRDTNPHFPHGVERVLSVAWDEGWCEGRDAHETEEGS